MEINVINWLLEGDLCIQYLTKKYLLEEFNTELSEKLLESTWFKFILNNQKEDGHWGDGYYRPKWACTHYTLLLLKEMEIPKQIPSIIKIINKCLNEQFCQDKGISFWSGYKNSDVCVNGMFLNYTSYFLGEDKRINQLIDNLLSTQMSDGGWNCRHLHGAVHSSLHSTLSVLEGLLEFRKTTSIYRQEEILLAESKAILFLLDHKLYKSHRTDEIIDTNMLKLIYPPHWRYDILKALIYLVNYELGYDERLADALAVIKDKVLPNGKWKLEKKHIGKEIIQMERVGKDSRWITLRALRVLKHFVD